MMWLDRLFPSSESVDKIVDSASSGVDYMFHTDEEKAEKRQWVLDLSMEFRKAMTPYKIAQRLIALTIVYNFFAAFWIGVYLLVLESEYLDGYLELVLSFNLGWLILAVVAFYFKLSLLDDFKKAKK